MWDKLRIRERERLLGMLFVGVQVAVLGGILLVLGFPLAGQIMAVLVLGIFWLMTVRRMIARRQSKYGPAAVGPLSPDERAKARSKLVRGYSRSAGCQSSSPSSFPL
jgi:membrane protein implicated in regulation of membrane protease activity